MRLCPLLHYTIILALTVFVSISTSSTSSDDEALWLTAQKKYHKGHYNSAIIDLHGLISSRHSSFESSARLLLGKCYFQLGDLNQAEIVAQRLITKFPHSRYVSHAGYLFAEIEFQRKDYYDSAWHLLNAAQTTGDEELRLTARDKLAGIFESYLNDNQREQLLNWVESVDILTELGKIQQGVRPLVKIGVILELSGPEAAKGEAVLAGIRYALKEAKNSIRHEIQLINRDSRGDIIEAVRFTQELIELENVIAIIGDLNGACTAAIAGIAAVHNIPLIIPAAKDGYLTEIGKSVFQLLVDYKLEGVIAAQYASSELKAHRATILAPASQMGSQTADGFTNKFRELGGEVEIVQWYYSGATNYKRQLDNLIRAGVDSLAVRFDLNDEEVTELLAWDEDPEEEEQEGKESEGSVVDSLLEVYNSPINFFDILYVPFEGEDILLLAPQIVASGFNGFLIGSSNCLDYVTRESNLRYVNGIIFPAHFSTPEGYSKNHSFAASFKSLSGGMPNRWNLLGWDAFNYLAEALEDEGRLSPKRVTDKLKEMRRFNGGRLEMVFPLGSGENHSLFILGFQNGRFHTLRTPRQVSEIFLR